MCGTAEQALLPDALYSFHVRFQILLQKFEKNGVVTNKQNSNEIFSLGICHVGDQGGPVWSVLLHSKLEEAPSCTSVIMNPVYPR
jgi:hypothetical protein